MWIRSGSLDVGLIRSVVFAVHELRVQFFTYGSPAGPGRIFRDLHVIIGHVVQHPLVQEMQQIFGKLLVMGYFRQHHFQLHQQFGMFQGMIIHIRIADFMHQVLFTDEVKFGEFSKFVHYPPYSLFRLPGLDRDVQFATQQHQHPVLRVDQVVAQFQAFFPMYINDYLPV